ncbi:MAG TPA: hypothetical protein VK671_01590 [Mucilaginibacter sp.]|nr:hypothetical protein [Mucilaginibacter sp.]
MKLKSIVAVFITFFLAINALALSGQTIPTTLSNPSAQITKIPYVIKVKARNVDSVDKTKNIAFPGDLILVEITNPKEFVDQRGPDRNKIVLYADGVELKGITSDLFNNIRKEDFKATDTVAWIPFILKRDTSTKVAWDYLYKLSSITDPNKLKVNITVAWGNMLPVRVRKTDVTNTEIIIVYFNKWELVVLVFVYIGLLIGLGIMVVKTDILKEGVDGAYSLAQTQLAFWTILIMGGFIYSFVLTEIASTLNTSVLLLLGINIGANGVANYIDYFKKTRPGTTYTPKQTQGFWRDILGDGTSINIQRFQTVAWNVVLGAYFTFYTFQNKTMPVFPDVLLTLAGVSSLTYVAAKPTET